MVFSFDTTGSMYPAIGQVKRLVKDMINSLFKDIPNLRVGIIAHGDYCDGKDCITQLELTDNQNQIINFVTNVKNTTGGDAPECYELVLHHSRTFKWTAGSKKVLILIGDDVPHPPHANPEKLDWRNELQCLMEAGVKVYGVQALGRSHATHFYKEISNITKGVHLSLDQFSELSYIISAVAYYQQSPTSLDNYQTKLVTKHGTNRNLTQYFDTIRGKRTTTVYEDDEPVIEPKDTKLIPVSVGRFQVLEVDEDIPIKDFVNDNGLIFKIGKGFYQFKESVKIQSYKEVILRDKKSGRFYTGDQARKLAGIPIGVDAKVSPKSMDKYNVFVQSTSANRKLKGGSKFLYEVDLDR